MNEFISVVDGFSSLIQQPFIEIEIRSHIDLDGISVELSGVERAVELRAAEIGRVKRNAAEIGWRKRNRTCEPTLV